MRLAMISAVALLASTTAAVTEHDPDSARETFLRERFALTAPAPISGPAPRGRQAGPSPALVAMVNKWADKFGVPRSVAYFHVERESGWNVRARNPASSATGLFQPVRASWAAIRGIDPKSYRRDQHLREAVDAELNVQVGLAHIRACMDFMPGAQAAALWKKCHVGGHGKVGGNIKVARAYFARITNPNGWIAVGSVAMPWARAAEGSNG